MSAHTDTYTINTFLMAQIQQLQQELAQKKGEKFIYKAQVEERSSFSTSVQNQLTQLTNKVENIRVTLIPKLNSIQATLLNTDDDIARMTDSYTQLENYSLQLDFMQGQLFNLQTKTGHNDSYMKTHFKKVEDALDHLTIGMQLFYTMIKYENPPTAKDRAFFEGGSRGRGGSGEEGGPGSGTGRTPRDEDPQAVKSKSVEESSTKGENKGASGSGGRGDKGKGKQHINSSDDEFYYQGEQDDFDAFKSQ